MNTNSDLKGRDANLDPITKEPGSHPVGVGVGAAAAGATGAAVGAVGGPIGSAVGAVIGAVAGGLAGKGVAEKVDPTGEDTHWRQNHGQQSYAAGSSHIYEDYAPAYRTGYEGYSKYEPGTNFHEAADTLREDYEASRGTSKLEWEHAKPAAEAAWNRVHTGEATRIQLSEEELKVGKREVEAGVVRLRKVVRTEQVTTPVQLNREEVTINRVTTGNLGQVPADAFQEGMIEVPLTREEAVVQKTAHVVGEVQVKKNVHTDTQQISETLRKEDVEVTNQGEAQVREGDINRKL